MKIFQVWEKKSEYIVLKCPEMECGHIFRRDTNLNVFGKEAKNSKCQRCGKLFPIKNNTLDFDPLHMNVDRFALRKEIINGKEVNEENPLKNKDLPEADFFSASDLK